MIESLVFACKMYLMHILKSLGILLGFYTWTFKSCWCSKFIKPYSDRSSEKIGKWYNQKRAAMEPTRLLKKTGHPRLKTLGKETWRKRWMHSDFSERPKLQSGVKGLWKVILSLIIKNLHHNQINYYLQLYLFCNSFCYFVDLALPRSCRGSI